MWFDYVKELKQQQLENDPDDLLPLIYFLQQQHRTALRVTIPKGSRLGMTIFTILWHYLSFDSLIVCTEANLTVNKLKKMLLGIDINRSGKRKLTAIPYHYQDGRVHWQLDQIIENINNEMLFGDFITLIDKALAIEQEHVPFYTLLNSPRFNHIPSARKEYFVCKIIFAFLNKSGCEYQNYLFPEE